MFVSNVSPTTFGTLPYATKRLGTRTFDGNGREFLVEGWFPMFLAKSELPESELLVLSRRIQKLEGLSKP